MRKLKGFTAHTADLWKKLPPAQKAEYVRRASGEDADVILRPVEKLRRKRTGLLDSLGKIVTELKEECGVESLLFWEERDPGQGQADGTTPSMNKGETFGIIGSVTGSRFLEHLQQAEVCPHEFLSFVSQNSPLPDTTPLVTATLDTAQQPLLTDASRNRSTDIREPDLLVEGPNLACVHLKRELTD